PGGSHDRRTILQTPHRWRAGCAPWVRTAATRSADDEHLVGKGLDGADAVIRPGEDEDPAAVARSVRRRLGPDELAVREREPGGRALGVEERLLQVDSSVERIDV